MNFLKLQRQSMKKSNSTEQSAQSRNVGRQGKGREQRNLSKLLIVLIVFYFLGCIVKIILDSSFKEEDKETTDGETASEDEEAGEDTAAGNIDADRENGQKDE